MSLTLPVTVPMRDGCPKTDKTGNPTRGFAKVHRNKRAGYYEPLQLVLAYGARGLDLVHIEDIFIEWCFLKKMHVRTFAGRVETI